MITCARCHEPFRAQNYREPEGYVCAACMVEELRGEIDRLRPDTALGALVRQMPDGVSLCHLYTGEWLYLGSGVGTEWLPTPEAALVDGLNKISRILENQIRKAIAHEEADASED